MTEVVGGLETCPHDSHPFSLGLHASAFAVKELASPAPWGVSPRNLSFHLLTGARTDLCYLKRLNFLTFQWPSL